MPSGRRDNTTNVAGGVVLPLKKNQVVAAADLAKFQSIDSLETYLLTQGYTQAKLNAMTKNDMIFATRKRLNIAG